MHEATRALVARKCTFRHLIFLSGKRSNMCTTFCIYGSLIQNMIMDHSVFDDFAFEKEIEISKNFSTNVTVVVISLK